MVLYQFLHQIVYLAIGRRNHFALFGLENNILYGLDLCRRARKPTLHHIGVYICHTPFLDIKVWVLLVIVLVRQGLTRLGSSKIGRASCRERV